MPKVRRSPPSTALGAWLEHWLADHPEVTHATLATDIGVSKGLISQWVSGAVKRIEAPNLAGLARVTGEPLPNLEQMVYPGRARPSEGLSSDLLDAIEERMRRAFREELRAALAELRGLSEGPGAAV